MAADETEPRPRVEISGAKGLIVGDHATQLNLFVPQPGTAFDIELTAVANDLAIAVKRQWDYESTRQQLNDPYAIPVQWGPADPALTTTWSALTKLATETPTRRGAAANWATGPAELAGSGQDLYEVLAKIPTGRLVVLGEKGAGKTILLVRLILLLLNQREQREPVPVLLPVASWNPDKEDLYRWIERWLYTSNPALAGKVKRGPRVTYARALLEAGLILPLLDGLDEMPAGLLEAAIGRINDVLHAGQQLVVACRTSSYGEAVGADTERQTNLTGAAGIELHPLTPATVIEYLEEASGGPPAASRWAAIGTALTTDERQPLAQALTTPLMASLARTVYNPRAGEPLADVPAHPSELLDTDRFPSQESIEEHLFDAFIPAAYRPSADILKKNRWEAGQATRWLTFLARDLEQRQGGMTDLAWWRLRQLEAGPAIGVSVGLVTAVAAGLTIPWRGWGLGIIAVLVIGLLFRNWIGSTNDGLPRCMTTGIIGGELAAIIGYASFGAGPNSTYLAAFISGGVALGVIAAPLSNAPVCLLAAFCGELTMGFYERSGALQGVRTAIGDGSYVINGIALGLVVGLCAGYFNRQTPARGLGWSWVGCAVGLGGGLIFAFGTFLTTGGQLTGALAGFLACGLGGGLYQSTTPTDLQRASSPLDVLSRDRATFLTSIALAFPLAAATGINIALSPPDPFNGNRSGAGYGIGIALALWIGIGFGFAFFQATWGGFTLIRCWLAVTGRLPLRLMSFLEDAHLQHSVLRQYGAVYQFRHAELQRRLGRQRLTSPSGSRRSRFSRTVSSSAAVRTGARGRPGRSRSRRRGRGGWRST